MPLEEGRGFKTGRKGKKVKRRKGEKGNKEAVKFLILYFSPFFPGTANLLKACKPIIPSGKLPGVTWKKKLSSKGRQ